MQFGSFFLRIKNFNKGCVTPWPCHFTLKKGYLKAKEEEEEEEEFMETQI